MQNAGKVIIWIGIVILILAGAAAACLFLMSAADPSTAEMFGWAILLSMLFGLPAAIIAAILILIGAVLVTSAPKRANQAVPSPPAPPAVNPNKPANKSRYVQAAAARAQTTPSASPDDALRAALRAQDSSQGIHLKLAVIGLRVLAVALFAWFFFPDAYWNVKFALMMPNAGVASVAMAMIPKFLGVAILPLILWLLSNLVKARLSVGRRGLA